MTLRSKAFTGALAALLAVLTVVSIAPAPNSSAHPVQQVQPNNAPYGLEFTAMEPAIPTATSDLRVSALFRNLSDDDLQRVTMVLRIGNQPLVSQQDIANVSEGIFRPRLPIVRYSDTAEISTGGEQLFSVELPIAELALNQAGVYPVAVEAIDVNLGSIAYTPTVLVWMPTDAVDEPLDVAMLWPLSLPPARDAADVITSPSLADQFATGGRLNTLLTSGAPFVSQLSWVLDPQTQQTAAVLAREHEVLESRSTTNRPGDPDAADWLTTQRRILSNRSADVSAMGYAYPDATSLVAAQLTGDVVLATTSAGPDITEDLGRPPQRTLSWAPAGFLDQPTLNVLRGAGTQAVVVSADSVQSNSSTGVVELTADSGTIPAVVGDSGLELAAKLAETERGQVVARQQFLAASALAALADVGGSRVFAPPATWSPQAESVDALLTNATRAPWMRVVPLTAVLTATDDSRAKARLDVDTDPVSGPLAAEQTELIRWGELVLAIIGQVTTSPSPELQDFRSALLRSGSTWWRSQPEMGSLQLSRTWDQIVAEQQRLSINTAGTIAFPGEEGRVPITVANDLDVPVSVALSLSAEPSYRLESDPQEMLDIPAGQRVSMEVPVRVIGSAPLTVNAQLVTPEGLPYGPSESFELRTAAYSRVAQWVIWGALAILVLLVARSVSSRIRAARDNPGDNEDGHGDV